VHRTVIFAIAQLSCYYRTPDWPNLGCLDTKTPQHRQLLWHCSHINMLLFIQVSLCLPLRHSGLHLWTILSQTLSCVISFSGLTFWITDSSLVFAVKKRCMIETTPCWIYWRQKTSASSFCTPYTWLDNNMLSTLSNSTEVRYTVHDHVITVLTSQSRTCTRRKNSQIASHLISFHLLCN